MSASSPPIVLDASAVLALLFAEPGAEKVAAALPQAMISAVNLAEVLSKLIDRGLSADTAEATVGVLALPVAACDAADAKAIAALRPATRAGGLSIGDRACLALGGKLGAVVLTADRSWRGLASGCGATVDLVR